jgi:hypothetical protein
MLTLGSIVSIPTKHQKPSTRQYLVCFDIEKDKPWHLTALLKSGMLGKDLAGSYFHTIRELDAYVKLVHAIEEETRTWPAKKKVK